jgi:hypothetical protein
VLTTIVNQSEQISGQSAQHNPMRCYPGQGEAATANAAFLLHASPPWQQPNLGDLAYPEINTFIHP